MMPKMKCNQRMAIISLACGVSRKEKCGCHSGKVWARTDKYMANSKTTMDRSGEAKQRISIRMGDTMNIAAGNRNGARERTRTSTALRPLRPERSASASSATRARVKGNKLRAQPESHTAKPFHSARHLTLCQRDEFTTAEECRHC